MKAVAVVLLLLGSLAVGRAWKCTESPRPNSHYKVVQVDAGHGRVVMRDSRFSYILTQSQWTRLSSYYFKHVTVGPAGLWAADNANRVFKFVAGNFVIASGRKLEQLDAGGDDHVVGIEPRSCDTYCLRSDLASAFKGVGSVSWTRLPRDLRYYSCSPKHGCWGVGTSYQVFFTKTINSSSCGTSGWELVKGPGASVRMIEIGTDGTVVAVTTNNLVFQRVGITPSNPVGTAWTQILSCMPIRHVSYDLGRLWAVTWSGFLLTCRH